jgi:adenylate cyclase
MAAVELSRETVPWQPVAGIAELYEGATEASKAQKRLQVLLSFSAALSRPQQLEANLKQIVEFVLQTTDVDRAALYLLKTPWVPGEPVEFRHRSQQTRTESVPVEPSMTVMTKVLETEQGLLIRDAQMNTQMAASASMLMQKIRTCICLPLKTPDRLLGVLYADAPRPLVLNEQDDVDFFSAFAALAAVALENNLLLQQVRREAVNRARFERFFPPNTLEAVLSGGDRLAGREQDVTVMFCDIRNYTEMSAKRNPREVAGLLNRYFQTLVPIVFRRNGTLEKYIGDALVAIWGAPVATPKVHQAGSACMAALDIQAAIAQLNARYPDLPLEVGIGIHHGSAYVGTIGNDSYLQYAAIGATTNLSARICGHTPAREVLVSREVADLLSGSPLSVSPQGTFKAKGFDDPVEVFRVTA